MTSLQINVDDQSKDQTSYIRISSSLRLSSQPMPERVQSSTQIFLELEDFSAQAGDMLLIHKMKLFTEWLQNTFGCYIGAQRR